MQINFQAYLQEGTSEEVSNHRHLTWSTLPSSSTTKNECTNVLQNVFWE